MRKYLRNRVIRFVGKVTTFIGCVLALLVINAVDPRTLEARTTDRPNVLFILADDLGWMDLGCYGSDFYETPHLDELASQGARFTQAYTAGSVCSPTRSSIMTGKYPVRTGITDYIPGLLPNNTKLLTKRPKTELSLDELTIGEAFQAGGYQTFYAGKWHLGDKGYEPDSQGFETYVSDRELGNHGRDWRVGDRITASAEKFFDDRDGAKPFFMFLGYHEPHTPTLEYPEHIDRFRAAAKQRFKGGPVTRVERNGITRLRRDDPVYASEVAGLDTFVGRVLAKLKANRLDENTVVVFLSDNGGLSTLAKVGPTSNEPLHAGKGWLYEGGIRVPMMVRAPGVTKPGTTIDVPVISTDFYPTLLELAGLDARPSQHLDGTSFASLLKDHLKPTRDALYWHYPHYHGSTWAPGGAVRIGDWKLIEFFEEDTVELYDLSEDVAERHDLAASNPEQVAKMRQALTTWRSETDAYMPPLAK